MAFYGIVTPLYVRDYWYLLSGSLRQAFAGNGLALALLADAYASKGPDGSYLNNSMEAFFAVSCLDDPTADRAGRGRGAGARLRGGLAHARAARSRGR